MARPNLSNERRAELIGKVAAAFAELGYRRTTTAELARRCGVQEPILYRLWPDKRAMFIASLEFVATHSQRIWTEAMAAGGKAAAKQTTAERVLGYEAEHLGEFGLYRILFAGWSETDDLEIRAALRRVYELFLEFITARVREHRSVRDGAALPAAEATAWALLGLGTVINLGRELDLLPDRARARLFASIGQHLLG